MMPSAQNSPAVRSATGMPTRTGPWPGRPVTDISPRIILGSISGFGQDGPYAGDAAKNDARVDLLEVLVVDAQPLLHGRPKILHHHVGFLDHAHEGGVARRRFEVERHAALVAVQILEIGTVARPAGPLSLFELRR